MVISRKKSNNNNNFTEASYEAIQISRKKCSSYAMVLIMHDDLTMMKLISRNFGQKTKNQRLFTLLLEIDLFSYLPSSIQIVVKILKLVLLHCSQYQNSLVIQAQNCFNKKCFTFKVSLPNELFLFSSQISKQPKLKNQNTENSAESSHSI